MSHYNSHSCFFIDSLYGVPCCDLFLPAVHVFFFLHFQHCFHLRSFLTEGLQTINIGVTGVTNVHWKLIYRPIMNYNSKCQGASPQGSCCLGGRLFVVQLWTPMVTTLELQVQTVSYNEGSLALTFKFNWTPLPLCSPSFPWLFILWRWAATPHLPPALHSVEMIHYWYGGCFFSKKEKESSTGRVPYGTVSSGYCCRGEL